MKSKAFFRRGNDILEEEGEEREEKCVCVCNGEEENGDECVRKFFVCIRGR